MLRHIGVIKVGKAVGGDAAAEEDDEAIGVGIRQRPQEHGVQDAEGGGAGGDTEGESNQCDGGEAGRLHQRAQGQAQVDEHGTPDFMTTWRWTSGKTPACRWPEILWFR
ncbi:MAG: hypothetical protein ACRD15_08855 [Vicinamibacterales bacterium]